MTDLLKNVPLAVFIFVVINFLIGALFIIYHLLKFGLDYKTRVLTVVFLTGSVILILLNFYFFFKVDWSRFIYEYFPLPEIL